MHLHLADTPHLLLPDGVAQPLAALDAALLAWLVLEGPTPRTRLAALLWPDKDADAARNSLRQRLFQLQKRLGSTPVAGTATLALSEGVAHDLDEADTVLGQIRGDDIAPGEFAQWLALQRARRQARVRAALSELADMAEAARDWDDALAQAREILALDPLSEEAHRRLIRLHYLAGDPAAALLAFDACERVLKDEIGALPSAETLALLRTIDCAQRAPALQPSPQRVPVSVMRPPRLVGREAERRAVAAAWRERRMALVLGEGGVGKSRLIEEFIAAQPGAVASGARPGDERVAYATASRLLRRLPRDAVAATSATTRAYLACLLPELGPPAALADEADRLRLFNACAQVVGPAGSGPSGVALDDLQFADRASIELFGYLVSAAEGPWLLASRVAEPSSAAFDWLATLRQDARCDVLDLQPLMLAEVEALLDSLQLPALASVPDPASLLRRTGGNPLFVLETIKAALGPGGAARERGLPALRDVRGLIGQRIQRLSRDAVQLARCAALAGPDFSIALAAQVAGKRTLELADPCAELEAAQILIDGAFAHDLIHEAARASVPAAVARELHAEIAQFVQANGGEPARIADHWEQAGRWPEAGHAYRAAAARAFAAGRDIEQCELLASAAACFDKAGDATARFAALLDRAQQFGGKQLGTMAVAAAEELQALAADDVQRLEALAVRLDLAVNRQEEARVADLAPAALAAARALGRDDLVIRFTMSWSSMLNQWRRPRESLALMEPLRDRMRGHGTTQQRWEFEMEVAMCMINLGRLAESLRCYEDALAIARESRRDDWAWMTMAGMASSLARTGRNVESCEMHEQALRLAADIGHAAHPRVMQEQHGLAGRLRDLGRYAQALDLLEPLLGRLDAEGMATDLASVHNRLGLLYLFLGQPARAHALLGGPMRGVIPGMALIRRALQGVLAMHLGRDAVTPMREALAMLDDPGDVFHRTACLFAAGVLPADEGEAMAAGAAAWAAREGRMGLALFGHVRAAARAADQEAWRRAAGHAESALALAAQYGADNFYLPELWLVAARVSVGLERVEEARDQLAQGRRWIDERLERDVPAPFRESFLHRNAVNREIRELAARLG